MVKGKIFRSSTDKVNKPKAGPNYKKVSLHQCQCSGSSQIPSQDDLNYHQFLSLYYIKQKSDRINLIIYDTENDKEEVKSLDTKLRLDDGASITQLPNGELFCYGGWYSGITLIIDRSYGFRMLPFGTPCNYSSALYFDNNIYCFGGDNGYGEISLSRKFDLEKNRWINLASLPEAYYRCHSVVINGNILVSGSYSKNLWLYSIEINSFSIIPYEFAEYKRKVLINVEKLYLFEWYDDGIIYESEDEYDWNPISKSWIYFYRDQMYCLYNKKKVYFANRDNYYQFDLKKKILHKIK